MNDLLFTSCIKGKDYENLRQDNVKDVEMFAAMNRDEDIILKTFFVDVNVINSDIEEVKTLLSKLQAASDEWKTIHKADIVKALHQRMDQYILEVLKKAKSIQAKLEDLDNANILNRSCNGCKTGTPVDRTRISITNSLRQRLKDLMEAFRVLHQRIMVDCRQAVERRFYVVTGEHLDEDTVDRIIKTGESETFLKKIIYEQGKREGIDIMKEMQERYDAAKEIEQNLLDLHHIFLNMSMMVGEQGERLNDIQHHVNEARTYVGSGAQQLKGASICRKSNLKRTGLLILLIFLVIVVLVVPISISLKK
ncbi:hypothetical protein KP509_10G050500 [Ceratopteris richardii]|uniref:t-SNARE coiled-coil homology domain-containing protein n=1 Tax=Ceratopteris richardii TaxID=49495 RepID=A0A8T2U1V5_CERRI|nr:hypothetical protein KP509_10G050500 [Ceratopteris richardii]